MAKVVFAIRYARVSDGGDVTEWFPTEEERESRAISVLLSAVARKGTMERLISGDDGVLHIRGPHRGGGVAVKGPVPVQMVLL